MRLLLALTVAVLLSGCMSTPKKAEGVLCEKPYIRVGGGCCFDSDDNSICDSDETPSQEPPSTEETASTDASIEPTTTTVEPATTSQATTTSTAAPTTSSTTSTMRVTTTSTSTTSTTSSTSSTTTQPILCSETDGGADEYVKGTTTWGLNGGTDRCLSTASLQEYYCATKTFATSKILQCPKGCLDGRCAGCVDTDGGDNPSVYGEVSLGDTLTKKDLCSRIGDGKTLQEYFCASRTELGSRQVVCDGGCADGRCL